MMNANQEIDQAEEQARLQTELEGDEIDEAVERARLQKELEAV